MEGHIPPVGSLWRASPDAPARPAAVRDRDHHRIAVRDIYELQLDTLFVVVGLPNKDTMVPVVTSNGEAVRVHSDWWRTMPDGVTKYLLRVS